MLWHRRRRREGVSLVRSPGRQAAQAALRRAEDARSRSQAIQPEVEAAALRLRTLREQNHFAEMITLALRLRGTP